ncbi:hypothetical protein IJE86_01370 [bacterium]|nr:hypothetical protein [bacterium]
MLQFLILILMLLWASITFILANIDVKEDAIMDKNIIEVTPNKDGKIFITLYGTRYQIVVKESKPKSAKTDKE